MSGLVSENTSMEMIKKEEDVSEKSCTPPVIKSEPVAMPLQSCECLWMYQFVQFDFLIPAL